MYPVLICTPEGDRLLDNGNPLPEELVQGGSREEKVRMYKSSGNFTGIYGWDERKQKYVPIRMFFIFLQKLAGADMEYLKIDGEFPRLSECGNTWKI